MKIFDHRSLKLYRFLLHWSICFKFLVYLFSTYTYAQLYVSMYTSCRWNSSKYISRYKHKVTHTYLLVCISTKDNITISTTDPLIMMLTLMQLHTCLVMHVINRTHANPLTSLLVALLHFCKWLKVKKSNKGENTHYGIANKSSSGTYIYMYICGTFIVRISPSTGVCVFERLKGFRMMCNC